MASPLPPAPVRSADGRWWVFPGGVRLPVLAGADGPPANPPTPAPAPPAPTPPAPPAPVPDGDLGDAGKRALEQERQRARDAEKARKAAEQALTETNERLAALETANQTDAEKAVAAARQDADAAARAEVTGQYQQRLVAAEVRATVAGRVDGDALDEFVAALDLGRLVGDDGDPDRGRITATVDRLLGARPDAPTPPPPGPGNPNAGARPTAPAATLDERVRARVEVLKTHR